MDILSDTADHVAALPEGYGPKQVLGARVMCTDYKGSRLEELHSRGLETDVDL